MHQNSTFQNRYNHEILISQNNPHSSNNSDEPIVISNSTNNNRRIVISIPRHLWPLRFLFISQHDFFSLHPNIVLSYDQIGRTVRSSNTTNHSTLYHRNYHHRCATRVGLHSNLSSGIHSYSCPKEVEDMDDNNISAHPNCISLNIYHHNFDDPITKVIDTFGLLELIFTFSPYQDILSASLVNQRWHQASRNDSVWKAICIHTWKNKVGTPPLRKNNSLALFWRIKLQPSLLDKLSVKEFKSFFIERPLGRKIIRETFSSCLEKNDMKNAMLQFMPDSLGEEESEYGLLKDGFRDLWFGCFVSSVIDSRRIHLTIDELLSRKGFNMYFKIMMAGDDYYDQDIPNNGFDFDPYHRRTGISLHFYCTCYFDESHDFRISLPEDSDFNIHHQHDLKWEWLVPEKVVVVGSYPPLVISRLENWGWKLENQHVVLYNND